MGSFNTNIDISREIIKGSTHVSITNAPLFSSSPLLLSQLLAIFITEMEIFGGNSPFRNAFARIVGEKGSKDSLALKVGIGVVLVALIALMFPQSESNQYGYTAGPVWADKDLVAPFSFPIYKEARLYEKERQAAAREV